MDDNTFQELLGLVTPYIERQDTKMRRAITAEERLTATLRFLAPGRSLEDLKFGTLISPQALGQINPDTCNAIVKVLQDQYLKLPASISEWQAMAEEFATTWQFPNCGGAIDGKHISINPYFNYKGYISSIVLMAVVNANYEFIFIDNTTFYEWLTTKTLNLPSREQTKHSLYFVFVADEAFALHENIMKPYPQRHLTREKQIYNYRLSRTRRIVENTFGILSSRFRIFLMAINLQVEKIDWMVTACCVLHNYLRRKVTQHRTLSRAAPRDPDPEHPEENSSFPSVEPPPLHSRASVQAKQVRNEYLAYFNGVGAVDWQEDHI
ncbi:putative nuclease HARBI1 [Pseudophryne corroboree]|uniref:putative nuclease HARBI1 n=1 Tax=Pseudophryne corroboree TaxID=495146 RepID=UPI0030812510